MMDGVDAWRIIEPVTPLSRRSSGEAVAAHKFWEELVAFENVVSVAVDLRASNISQA